MARKLKVYGTRILASNELREAVGVERRELTGVVAAYNRRQAAALFGQRLSDFSWSGGERNPGRYGPRETEALAHPGQVFVYAKTHEFGTELAEGTKVVHAAVSIDRPVFLLPHRSSDLALADAILAAEERRKAEAKEREAAWEAKREADRLHRIETERRAQEVLEALRPALVDLGVHPATVTLTVDGQRVGILVPAETLATLVNLAQQGL